MDIENILARYQEVWSLQVIADELGVAYDTLRTRLRRVGIRLRPIKARRYAHIKARRMARRLTRRGYTLQEIEQMTGISSDELFKLVKYPSYNKSTN